MPQERTQTLYLTEHILEVRHAASGSFLDVRGFVADFIRNQGLFSHWKIASNVVRFFDADGKIEREGAFAGYKSSGYVAHNPDTTDYFKDRASKYWRTLMKNNHYHLPELTRFGARTKFFFPNKLPFEETRGIVFEKFVTKEARDLIGGTEKDVHFTFELVEGQFDVRVAGGPVDKGEVERYLSFESEHFDSCGLFLDLDYYRETDLDHKKVPQLLNAAMNLTWEKVNRIASALGF